MDCECILCGYPAIKLEEGPLGQRTSYSCKNCGKFHVSDQFESLAPLKDIPLYLISGYVREQSDLGNEVFVTYDNWKDILQSPMIARYITEKLIKLLSYYNSKSRYFGDEVQVSIDPAICYAKNIKELESVFHIALGNKYLVKLYPNFDRFKNSEFKADAVTVTYTGNEFLRVAEKNSIIKSKEAFVAMWFDDQMDHAYENAICKALETCGYDNNRVDKRQHNNDITDEIIAGIRRCRFVIADLTGYRAGVYYEAGFARGLGKPVILSCRSDWFNSATDQLRRVHFDVNHLNIIVWDEEEELRQRIVDRINATIF